MSAAAKYVGGGALLVALIAGTLFGVKDITPAAHFVTTFAYSNAAGIIPD